MTENGVDKMLNVLQVLGGLNRGGAETLIINTYKELLKSGCDVHFDFVIHNRDMDDYYEELIKMGSVIHFCPPFVGKNFLAYKKWWNEFFEKHKQYSIIHGNVRSTASIYLKIAKKHSVATVAHSHSAARLPGFSGLIKELLQKGIPNYADCMVGCSEKANEYLFGKKNLTKTIVLNNGIDFDSFSFSVEERERIREELHLQNKVVLGTVSRIEYPKNPLFIVEVVKELWSINKNVVFLWVGDGTLLPEVKKRVDQYGLQGVFVFPGKKDNVSPYLSSMDGFIFPSKNEGLGISLVEAQANGLPCFCSDTIPSEAIIAREKCTIISLSKTPEEWASSINDVVMKQLGNSRCDVSLDNSDFSIEKTASDLLHIYRKVLGKYE